MLNTINSGLLEGAGVFLSITLIIVLIRRGWKMYHVLLLGVLILALTNANSLSGNGLLLFHSLTSPTALYLGTMVAAITLLGHLHREVGAMEILIESLRRLIRDPRALLMIIPAAVSLFSTVPGGAIVSAPMIEETGRELKMSRFGLALSNMVYRHLVVMITPFNASLVLASGITGISIGEYLGFTVPVVAVVFALSALVMTRLYRRPESGYSPPSPGSGRTGAPLNLLVAASPYILAITLGLGLGVFFPLALAAGMALCLFLYLPGRGRVRVLGNRIRSLHKGLNLSLIVSTLGIVVYKDFILEADSFVQAVGFLFDRGLPLFVLLLALPFVTGFITGNNAASLGIAVPLLLPFLGPEMQTVRYFGIIYLSSYAGYLGSPVHLCTYLTNEYFKTPLYSLIWQVNLYGLFILGVGIVFSFFY